MKLSNTYLGILFAILAYLSFSLLDAIKLADSNLGEVVATTTSGFINFKMVSIAVVDNTLVVNEVVLPFDPRMDRIVVIEVEGRA